MPSGPIGARATPAGVPAKSASAVGATNGPAARVEILSIPNVRLDSKGKATFTIEVPKDAVGWLVTVVGNDRSAYRVTSLEGPDRKREVLEKAGDARRSRGSVAGAMRTLGDRGLATFLFPSSEAASLKSGTWKVEVCANDAAGKPVSGDIAVQVQLKRCAKPPERGRLPVHLHFTGAGGWTAKTAAKDPRFQEVLKRVRESYASAGLDIAVRTNGDVPRTFQKLEMQDRADSLGRMFRLSREPGGVHIYFVDALCQEGVPVAQGISGSIPGPALPGTRASGLTVALRNQSTEDLAQTLAHEIGHYLGLHHTVEADQSAVDHFSDTSPSLEKGVGNLMYPIPYVAPDALTVSKQQKRVLFAHPLIEH